MPLASRQKKPLDKKKKKLDWAQTCLQHGGQKGAEHVLREKDCDPRILSSAKFS